MIELCRIDNLTIAGPKSVRSNVRCFFMISFDNGSAFPRKEVWDGSEAGAGKKAG